MPPLLTLAHSFFLQVAYDPRAATHAASSGLDWWAELKDGIKVLVPFILFFVGRSMGKGDKQKEKRESEDADLVSAVKELKRRADENTAAHTGFQQQIENIGNMARNAEGLGQQNKANYEALNGAMGRTESRLETLINRLLDNHR